jgi:hypothetical protein
VAKLGRPRIEPSEDLITDLTKIKEVTKEIHDTQRLLLNLAKTRRRLVRYAKEKGATHRAIYEYGGAYVRNAKVKNEA